MVSMPNISTAKPSRIIPTSFFLSLLAIMVRTTPMSARMGVKEVGLSSMTKKLSPSKPVKLRIQAVTVVPTLAPIMTLMACRRVSSPEFTKPTTITVVAEELWITAVTPIPVKNPNILREVSFPNKILRLLPALFSREAPIRFMPNKNRLSPPNKVNTSNRSIV